MFHHVCIFICFSLAWQTALAITINKPKPTFNSSSNLFTQDIHSLHKPFKTAIHGTLISERKPYSALERHLSPAFSPSDENYFLQNFSCENVTLRELHGSFYNPGYPLSFKNNSSCSWFLEVRTHEIVTISFDDLDIPADDDSFCQSYVNSSASEPCCRSNAFIIRSKNKVFSEKRYCGRSEDNKHIFSTFIHQADDVLEIIFQVSGFIGAFQHGGRGFHANYFKTWIGKPCIDETEYKCANGKCIPKSRLCNRRDECGDGSDEHSCAHVCRESNEALCSYSHRSSGGAACFSFPRDRCDGTWDCVEGTDERGCDKCPPDKFVCSSGKICYSSQVRCDGSIDCLDFKDEINCGACGANMISCGSGNLRECYHPNQRCDGVYDCPNGKDEMSCERLRCDKRILCSSGDKCFAPEKRCNGVTDCADASDEHNCTISLCRPEQGLFLCANRNCIKQIWLCDRSNDCNDGSDEANCLRNSVITAVLMGSLICGVLLVIAISCTCKLIALRQVQQQHHSHSDSARGHSGNNLYSSHPYHRYFPFGNTQTSNSLFILDNGCYYRDPPPSYAHAVASDCDRSRRRNPRRMRSRNRRRPPTPPPLQQSPDSSETSEALIVPGCPAADSSAIPSRLRPDITLPSNSNEGDKSTESVKQPEAGAGEDGSESGDEASENRSPTSVNIELNNIPCLSSPTTDCDQQPLLSG